MSEFDVIRRMQELIALPAGSAAFDCVVGIGDDGAVLDVSPGRQLVVCTDTLVGGVHFPVGTSPSAIGHKALAVNLSDLAAMGAEPAWFFMAITLPSADPGWIDDYSRGTAELARVARISLAGGDVSSGPLSVTVTALGLVDKGQALSRSGARPGDLVVVSGAPGAAANALRQLKKGATPSPSDLLALEYPVPRLELGRSLAGLATSCIDVSDGLAADLGHILEQSQAGAVVELERLPCPESLREMDGEERWPLQLSGGDDYELCFTIPPSLEGRLDGLADACGVGLTSIGEINSRRGLFLKDAGGERFQMASPGYRHFNESMAECK